MCLLFHSTNILGHSFTPRQIVLCSSEPWSRTYWSPLLWVGHRTVTCWGFPVSWNPPNLPSSPTPCSLNRDRASSFMAHDAQRKEMRLGEGGSFITHTHTLSVPQTTSSLYSVDSQELSEQVNPRLPLGKSFSWRWGRDWKRAHPLMSLHSLLWPIYKELFIYNLMFTSKCSREFLPHLPASRTLNNWFEKQLTAYLLHEGW